MQSRFDHAFILVVLLVAASVVRQPFWAAHASEAGFSLSARVFLRESDVLDGCRENFDGRLCEGNMGLIVSGEIGRTEQKVLPGGEDSNIPNPLFNRIAHSMAFSVHEYCTGAETSILSDWLEESKSDVDEIRVALLPEKLVSCLDSLKPGQTPVYNHFWLFSGENVVASMNCAVVGSVPNPLCSLSAYTSEGKYWAQLGFYPAVNADKVAKQLPGILWALLNNLPAEQAKLLRFDWVNNSKIRIDKMAGDKISMIEAQLR